MKKRVLLLASIALAMLLVSGARTGAQEQQQTYTVTDVIGFPPGKSYIRATAMNGSGQVVGYADADEYYREAFLYENGQTKDLGFLPGGRNSEAHDINGSGQVVGESQTSAGDHAFLYENGQMVSLGTLPGSDNTSGAKAINESGQVVGYSGVGYSESSSGNIHAFLYENGQMKDLGTLPGGSYSFAEDINSSGQVVGWANTASGYLDRHAFLYENGQMKDLGTLPGGDESRAVAINDSGQVVGYSDVSSGSSHAFLYENGQMKDLGTLPTSSSYPPSSGATAISGSGQVVGSSSSDLGGAFLYENGQMKNLNDHITSDSVIGDVTDINDAGQLLGGGVHNGQSGTFILTPSEVDTMPPRVDAVNPAEGKTSVARGTNLRATFSEQMDPASINKSTYRLFRCPSRTSTNCTTQVTNAIVRPSEDGLSATLDPYGASSSKLGVKTKYKAVVTTGAKDVAGNALDQNSATAGNQQKAWYFTTGSM